MDIYLAHLQHSINTSSLLSSLDPRALKVIPTNPLRPILASPSLQLEVLTLVKNDLSSRGGQTKKN